MITVFDLIRFTPLIIIFSIAAYQDFKTGEANNKLWVYSPIGLILTIIQYLFTPNIIIFVYAVFGAILSISLFYFKAWGGADTKALILVSLAFPVTPNFLPTSLIILAIAALAALPQIIIKKQKTLRYLPYLLIGTIISLLF